MTQATADAPPPGWGNDQLSKFIGNAHRNQYATFFRKRKATSLLVAIDNEFAKVSTSYWLNPKNEIAAVLLLRCHGAFRTSASLAMSGQCAETYVQCRSMLEYAAYAVHIDRDPSNSLGRLWFDRHVDPATTEKQRNAFSHRKVAASVTAASRHAGKRFENIYQRTIDFGGHPNERAVTGNLEVVEEPDRTTLSVILQHRGGVQLDAALKTTAQCGMVSLEMLETVYAAKFELLGIKAAMLALRRRL